MSSSLRLLTLLGFVAGTACATVRGGSQLESMSQALTVAHERSSPTMSCIECEAAIPLSAELTRAIETRLSDLEQRGGVCSRYGEVLEQSYRDGRITLRPYMWRVGGRLVSGEARPNGDMVLALEIDSLNVGVRTIDDVVWSVEHEAAHIAFHITPDAELQEDRANRYVRACRSGDHTG